MVSHRSVSFLLIAKFIFDKLDNIFSVYKIVPEEYVILTLGLVLFVGFRLLADKISKCTAMLIGLVGWITTLGAIAIYAFKFG